MKLSNLNWKWSALIAALCAAITLSFGGLFDDQIIGISGGGNLACVVLPGGTINCWGSNAHGALGAAYEGDFSERPVAVSGITDAVKVSVREEHACALLGDGHVKCWGANTFGQLGDGTFTDSQVPVDVLDLSKATDIAAGTFHTCALLAGGSIKCWGYNGYGQLGDGTFTHSPVPRTAAGISTARTISAGGDHNCSVLVNQTIRCWGWNALGQIGVGSLDENVMVATQVPGIDDAVAVTNGDYHTCALHQNGTVSCWGLNGESPPSSEITVPGRSPRQGEVAITRLSSLAGHVGLRWAVPDGGAERYVVYYAPKPGVTETNYVNLGGEAKTVANRNRTVIGQLANGMPYYFRVAAIRADGTSTISDEVAIAPQKLLNAVPTRLQIQRQDGRLNLQWSAVGGGASYNLYYASESGVTPHNYQTLADGTEYHGIPNASFELAELDEDRTYHLVVTANYAGTRDGQLGIGSYDNASLPSRVRDLEGVVRLEAGYANTCALLSNGSVECWGRNLTRQLGAGSDRTSSSLPVKVTGISSATDISVSTAPCAVVDHETVHCWGGVEEALPGNGSLILPVADSTTRAE